MLIDSQNLFSLNQGFTKTTSDSTFTLKFGKGDVSYVPFMIVPLADFTTTESILVQLVTAVDEEFSEPVELFQFTVNKEDLIAGKLFPVAHLPKGNLGYMKVVYTLTFTDGYTSEATGRLMAGVVAGIDTRLEE